MKRFLYPVIACVLLLCASACEIHFDLDKISEAKMYVQYLPSLLTGKKEKFRTISVAPASR